MYGDVHVVRADSEAAGMAEIGGSTQLLGLIGWPVDHSLSPRMQNAALAAAFSDARPGFVIGVGGSPRRLRVL